MPSIMMTVIAAALVAFALVAGVSYVNPSALSRVEVGKVLGAQYATYMAAIAGYRIENSGIAPDSLDTVDGYVNRAARSGFGEKSLAFTWSMARNAADVPVLCVTYKSDPRADYGVLQGMERLATDAALQRPGKVTLGESCDGDAVGVPPGGLAAYLNAHKTDHSLRIEVD